VDDLDLYGTWEVCRCMVLSGFREGCPLDGRHTARVLDARFLLWWTGGYRPWAGRLITMVAGCLWTGFWAWAPGPVVCETSLRSGLVAFLGGPVRALASASTHCCWVALGWRRAVRAVVGACILQTQAVVGRLGWPRVVNNVVINITAM